MPIGRITLVKKWSSRPEQAEEGVGIVAGSGNCKRAQRGEKGVQVIGNEARILEVAEETEIADQADDEPELAGALLRSMKRTMT